MATREFMGILFEESELGELQAMAGTGATRLLDRILVSVAQRYESDLHDPLNGIEKLRFCQGALEYGGVVNQMIKSFMEYTIGEEDNDVSDGEEAATPELNW